jgi:hypothetical protein
MQVEVGPTPMRLNGLRGHPSAGKKSASQPSAPRAKSKGGPSLTEMLSLSQSLGCVVGLGPLDPSRSVHSDASIGIKHSSELLRYP